MCICKKKKKLIWNPGSRLQPSTKGLREVAHLASARKDQEMNALVTPRSSYARADSDCPHPTRVARRRVGVTFPVPLI